MYSILLITNNERLQSNFFNIRIKLTDKGIYLKRYNLSYKGNYKIYHKNNILIKSNENGLEYYKIIEKSIQHNNDYLFIEHEKVLNEPFSFYETDYEEEYALYENTIDGIIINFKEFKHYCELEYITDDLNKFNKLISE